jgi:plasmid maintenance system antidote protein VapI
MTPGFWMGLQDEFELRKASYALKDELKAIQTWEFVKSA